MLEFFRNLFDPSGFPARWNCGVWTSGHGWLHILADLGVWSAYTAIPVTLAYFILRRRDMPFPKVFWLFAAFIFSCGATHLIDATMFWWPAYRFSGLMKLTTAVISWATVAALIPILPKALALPGLATVNRQLAASERDYRELAQSLEQQVAERTAVAERRADQLRVLATHVAQAEQRERHRLSMVLHDDLQQILVAAQMRLQSAPARRAQEDGPLAQVEDYLRMAIKCTRSVSTELRPPTLKEQSLRSALDALSQTMRQQHHLHVDVNIAPDVDVPDHGVRTLLHQAARELLFNAVKHGRAERAHIMVRSAGNMLEMVVRDEGQGFDPANTPISDGLGLSNIRQQLRLADGKMTFESAPGQGASVTLQLPLN